MNNNSQLILLLLLLVGISNVSSAQTLWSEDFESYADNSGYLNSSTSGDYPISVTKWTLDVSAATLSANSDWFMVNKVSGNNLFETRDTDGECIWTSESIAITNYTGVSISVSISETGNLNASDYIKLYYKIDGGSETLFSTNGSNVDDFSPLTASQSNLSGETLEIIIKSYSDNGSHKIRFDDIIVTAKRTDPASFSTASASSTSVSFSTSANSAGDNIVVAYNTSNTFGTPTGAYSVADLISGGGTVYYTGSAASITNHTGLSTGQTYYYKAWSFDGTSIYSEGLTSNATPACVNPNDVSALSGISKHTFVDLAWTNGLCGDEILVIAKAGSTISNTPSGDGSSYTSNSVFGSGTDIGSSEYVVYKGASSSVSVTGLTNGTLYYFKVFSRVGTNWNAGISTNQTPNQLKLIFTEIADPSNSSSARFIEIKNVSNSTIDFNTDTYYISRQSNGGNTWKEFQLTGTIASGCIRAYAKNSNTFNTKYGFTPDFVESKVDGSGNDTYCIYSGGDHNSGSLVDLYGVIDVNGNDENWEYTDSRAIRSNGVSSGLVTWDVSEWSIVSADVDAMTPDALENEFRYIGSTWRPDNTPPSSSSSSKAVVVQSGTTSLSADVDCASLETMVGSSFEISAGTGVTVNGDITGNCTLVLNSNSSSSASLKCTGEPSGTIQYKMYLSGGESSPWHLVTSPVVSQSINGFVTDAGNSIQTSDATNNYALAIYNTTTDAWNYYHNGAGSSPNVPASSAGDFVIGKGYSILRSASGEVSFSGTMNKDDQTVSLAASKWNLVGNPYTSFVNVNTGAHSTDNIISASANAIDDCHEAIYLWDASTSTYKIINHASSASFISPGQAIFVLADSDAGDYSFTEEMQSHQSGDWFERIAVEFPTINLVANFESSQSNTEIKYIDGATIGLDLGYDAGRFTGGDNNYFISSKFIDGTMFELDLALQCIPSFNANESDPIPINVFAIQESQITFSLELENFAEDTLVFIEDLLLDTYTRLDVEGSSYTTIVNEFTNNSERFFLHTQTSTIGIEVLDENSISIFTSNQGQFLNIIGEITDNTSFRLFDSLERIVFESELRKSNKFSLPTLPKGVYIVQLFSGQQTIIKKIKI